MRVQFVQRDNGPERLVCEAELVFDEAPLDGMKLVGFSLWKGPEDDIYVTFPARPFGAGTDRRYFDFLRPAEGPSFELSKKLKAWIVGEFRAGSRAA